MKVFKKLLIGFILVGFFLMAGCGGDGDNGGYRIAEYRPLGQGDTWTYGWEEIPVAKMYDEMDTVTISGTETINGVEAVKYQYSSGWYALLTNTNGLTRYKDGVETEFQRVYTPPLVEYPAKVSVGEQHTFYSEVTYTDADGIWVNNVSIENTLEGIEEVTVPAGTFPECLKFTWTWTYVFSGGGFTVCEITEWLVKHVGTVKYTEQCQRTDPDGGDAGTWAYMEELVTATVGGVNYPGSSAKGVGGATKRLPLSVSPNRGAPRW